MSADRAHVLRCKMLDVLGTCAFFGAPSLSLCCRPMIVLETLRHGLTKSSFMLVNEGYRVRVYVPFGREWFPYFMRRLGERPANVSFVIRGIVGEQR